jgi:periplasmic protein TonB
VAGTAAGDGSGTGGGDGRGPGNGSGDGLGAGDVYESGSGGVSAPSLIYEVKPNFTVDAMRAKIQGIVLMDVVVLANGSVDPARIRITRSLGPGLDQQALIAVRQWKFRPSRRLGQPVASRVTVELAFTLR